jgi:dTDP-4-amino-4,6-dideoxygalactose transaminase
MSDRIYLSPPHLGIREGALVREALDSNWVAPMGPHVDAFEREVAAGVGASHAVALSSGTAGIHLGLHLLGVGPGDEVLCSSLTFAASANPVVYLGARPVFIDSVRGGWGLDPDLLSEELAACARRGRMPRALVAVDLYGECADYDRILPICREWNLPLLEDAAEALGGGIRGRQAGTFGDLGVFSFNGNKMITTSGGGMLVSENGEWIRRARHLASQAREAAPHYEHWEVGYNYRLSNILAAIGRGQFAQLEERLAARRSNRAVYRALLAGVPGVRFVESLPGHEPSGWMNCVLVDEGETGVSSEVVRLALEGENIESRPCWKPLHLQRSFSGCRVLGGRESEKMFAQGLCLPSGSSLSMEQLERVAAVVRRTILHGGSDGGWASHENDMMGDARGAVWI